MIQLARLHCHLVAVLLLSWKPLDANKLKDLLLAFLLLSLRRAAAAAAAALAIRRHLQDRRETVRNCVCGSQLFFLRSEINKSVCLLQVVQGIECLLNYTEKSDKNLKI